MFRGIKSRIISTYLFLILISMAVVGITLIWLLQNYLLSGLEENMVNQTKLVGDLIEEEISSGSAGMVEAKAKALGEELQARITVIMRDGRVLADSELDPFQMENHRQRPEIKAALENRVGTDVRLSSSTRVETMYVAVPVEAGNQIWGAARLGLPLNEVKGTFWKFRSLLLVGILIATCVALLLSVKLAQGLTGPIENISRGAKRIAEGDWNTRVYAGSRDEIGELGGTINYMTRTLKEQIDEVSQEKSRLENILKTMGSGVIVLDHHGLVLIVNPAAQEMFGISGALAQGKHSLEVIRHFGLNNRIEECLLKETVLEYEFSLRFPEQRDIQCYLAPVYRDKTIAGVTIVFHDITRLRRLEQMRADFVANASHELRTPLTVIQGYVETLLHGALDDREVSEKFVAVIDQEAGRLKRLVDELLILSQVESSREEAGAGEQPVQVLTAVKSVVDELKPRFTGKGILLEPDLPEELPPVRANPDRVKQVLVNLLDNALKYTPAGGHVWVYAVEEGKDVKISVKDTGIGIPARELPRVFERFYRVDKARSRRMGGFGLGLSIVRHIVENYGGRMGVESTVNEGSTFWFTLPKYKAS